MSAISLSVKPAHEGGGPFIRTDGGNSSLYVGQYGPTILEQSF